MLEEARKLGELAIARRALVWLLPRVNKVMAVLAEKYESEVAVDECRPSVALRGEVVQLHEIHRP